MLVLPFFLCAHAEICFRRYNELANLKKVYKTLALRKLNHNNIIAQSIENKSKT